MKGVVSDFDDDAGWGTVTADDGGSFPFHCTAVADGSRSIAPGTTVAFRPVPGHHGRWEATELYSC